MSVQNPFGFVRAPSAARANLRRVYFAVKVLIKKHPVELAVSTAVLIFCFGFYWSTFANALNTSIESTGQRQSFGSGSFGDAFGAVNALFTGLALLGLVISILLQRAELNEVKQERAMAHQMLQIQIEMNKALEDDLRSTRLEDRFFKLFESAKNEIQGFHSRTMTPKYHFELFYRDHQYYWDEFHGVVRLKVEDANYDPLATYGKYGAIYEHIKAAYITAKGTGPEEARNHFYSVLGSLLKHNIATAIVLIVDVKMTKDIEKMLEDLDLYSRCDPTIGAMAKVGRYEVLSSLST